MSERVYKKLKPVGWLGFKVRRFFVVMWSKTGRSFRGENFHILARHGLLVMVKKAFCVRKLTGDEG